MKKLFIFPITIFLSFIILSSGCKRNRIKNHCCENPPLVLYFDTGYLFIPNIFTPDGDSRDDQLDVKALALTTFKMTIKDNKGVQIFTTTDLIRQWDGKKNNKLKDGIFYCEVVATTITGKNIKAKVEICSLIMSKMQEGDCLDYGANCVFGSNFSGGFWYWTKEGTGIECN